MFNYMTSQYYIILFKQYIIVTVATFLLFFVIKDNFPLFKKTTRKIKI